MDITLSYIPKISPNCSWKSFDNNNYLVCIDNGINSSKLHINKEVKKILDLVDGNRSVLEISEELNKINNWNINHDDLIKVLNTQLGGYGIFDNEIQVIKNDPKDKYISLKISLVNAHTVKKITKLITFLFGYKIFFTLFSLSFLLCVFIFIKDLKFHEVYDHLTPNTIVNFLIINIITLFIHEFGHAAACEKFGANSGKIGFGFYILTPVFFSDVSDAWRLNRKQRLIVDLGGIYIQLLILAFLNVYYIFSGDKSILILSSLIGIGILFNLNPFLRFDGYWALSDALNIVNLKDRSVAATGIFCGWVIGINKKWKATALNIFLASYGLTSFILTIAFIFYMLIIQRHSIFYLPKNLFLFINEIITTKESLPFNWYKGKILFLFPPLTFYIIIIIIIAKKLKEKKTT